jgi:hypothetical protein
MSFGERLAGTALQVTFEVASFGLFGERELADKSPWSPVNCRVVLAGVVAG